MMAESVNSDEVEGRRVPVAVTVTADLSPSCDLDRQQAATDRAAWAAFARERLGAQPLRYQPPSDAIYLFHDDLPSAWFEEVEEAGGATIVTLLPTSEAVDGRYVITEQLAVVSLKRSFDDVATRIDADDLSICHVSLDSEAWEIAASANSVCELLWWATPDGLAGFHVDMLWPLPARAGSSAIQEFSARQQRTTVEANQ